MTQERLGQPRITAEQPRQFVDAGVGIPAYRQRALGRVGRLSDRRVERISEHLEDRRRVRLALRLGDLDQQLVHALGNDLPQC